MRDRKVLAAGLIIAIALSGCAMQDREWDGCAIAGAVIGATAGGIAGGVTQNNVDNDSSNQEKGLAIGGGILGGAALGALLGHAICDPVKAPAAPPPVAAAPPPPPPPGTKLATVGSAYFDFNKAVIRKQDHDVLADVAKLMKDNPSIKVSVEGHTDSIGSDAYNQKLSERRAMAVKMHLVELGIDGSRISTVGYGKSKPVASNKTDEGRAQNRRVEVITR